MEVETLQGVLKEYWGYDEFRSLQEEAMNSVINDRDSLVVLPTGGGKSLCYQAPAMCKEGLAVVVSPLISLMKDQVDDLKACGIPAAFLNSTLQHREQNLVFESMYSGELKLLYIAPERLTQDAMIQMLKNVGVSFFAIDEAHCVSAWGHDFRPHYRELHQLKKQFPGVAVHAYTATATELVRTDIVDQLSLKKAETFVGSFDRPNLKYAVSRRVDKIKQLASVIDRHSGESGIIYCITRKDVDEISNSLNTLGYKTRPYHAGMDDDDRSQFQEDFIQDRVQVIVATIAFGMGIDKPDVRFVAHAALPKSLENYQQESGRAGRDGLDSECVLLYGDNDQMTWERIFSDQPDDLKRESIKSVRLMLNYCRNHECRHRMLVEHFGQQLEEACATACDICRGDFEMMDDSMVLGQKIVSSVYRQNQNFGASYTANVLKGSRDKRLIANGHDQVSTYGILKKEPIESIRHWIGQLVAQGFLYKEDEYQTLKISTTGWQLLKGNAEPRLVKQAKLGSKSQEDESWEGVNRDLFDDLRGLRVELARERGIPPYVVFNDVTLRALARHRPSTLANLLRIKGIGQKKCDEFGEAFIECLDSYCEQNDLPRDFDIDKANKTSKTAKPRTTKLNESTIRSFEFFERGLSVQEVAEEMGRARTTVTAYFNKYIEHNQITDSTKWLDKKLVKQIEAAIDEVGYEKLRPIYDQLEGNVVYDDIHLVVSCRKQRDLA